MNRKIESAIVVAPRIWKSSKNYHNSIEEISLLVSTLGVKVKGVVEQKINTINSTYFIGSGKAKQVIEQAKMLGVDYIIFDEDLSPVQTKNFQTSLDQQQLHLASLNFPQGLVHYQRQKP